jgi:hypothetical protein
MPSVSNIHPKGVKIKRAPMPNPGVSKPLGKGHNKVKSAGATKTNSTTKTSGLRVALPKSRTAKPKKANDT